MVDNQGQTAESVTVGFKGEGSDTNKVDATIVGVDNSSDVALLKIDPGKAGDLTVLPLGDSDKLQVGEQVVAIGNPLGYDFTLTTGVVSALDRELQSPNGSVIADGIQTDAAINHGNSGGPLIDATGHVIGINEQIASQSGAPEGIGFAVPINTAIRVMDQLKSDGQVTYAWLGIQGQTLTRGRRLGTRRRRRRRARGRGRGRQPCGGSGHQGRHRPDRLCRTSPTWSAAT